jgi:hypothetical protein
MESWKSYLRAGVTKWLLEESNPSVRYLTLKGLLERDEGDREVRGAKQAIMETGVVPRLLDKQVDGTWNSPGRFYVEKYKGTVWQLIVLAEHEASGANERIRGACEYILRSCQDLESCGFSVNQSAAKGGGRHSEVIPCLTGNMVWSLAKLGYLNDQRVQQGIRWITDYQRFDDGEDVDIKGWPYERYQMCWGNHSCHMGVVKSLKALSAIPVAERNKAVKTTIRNGCEYVLKHHIHKKSHNLEQTSKPGWLKLQFPLMYQTDVLEIAGILLELGIRDHRMDEAMEAIVSKQGANGKWNMETTFNGRYQVNIENKGKPSKWITLRALKAIKGYYG